MFARVVAFMVAIMTSSLGFAAGNSLRSVTQVQAIDTYHVVDQDFVRGFESQIDSRTQVIGTGLFSSSTKNLEPENQKRPNSTDLTSIGSNSLRMEDRSKNLNRLVSAKVSKSWLGKLKSIVISSDEMKAVYRDTLSGSARSVFDNITKEGSTLGSVEMSDYVCSNNEGLLTCRYSATIQINIIGR